MDSIPDIIKSFRDRQEKYVYYVIALSVASIGFSVYNTTGKPLSLTQVPLGFAVLCWALSVYCGLKFLQYLIAQLYKDQKYLSISRGQDSDIGTDPRVIEIAKTKARDLMRKDEKFVALLFKGMQWGFYIGVVAFLCWHVTEMYYVPATK